MRGVGLFVSLVDLDGNVATINQDFIVRHLLRRGRGRRWRWERACRPRADRASGKAETFDHGTGARDSSKPSHGAGTEPSSEPLSILSLVSHVSLGGTP
jgi:hypothetical protein